RPARQRRTRQVIKKNRSDSTRRRKRDMQADYTPEFAPSSRRVSTAETLRYRLLLVRRNEFGQLGATSLRFCLRVVTIVLTPIDTPRCLERVYMGEDRGRRGLGPDGQFGKNALSGHGLRRVPINWLPENHTILMAANDESAMLMQRMQDPVCVHCGGSL